jgi:hypothetical protein
MLFLPTFYYSDGVATRHSSKNAGDRRKNSRSKNFTGRHPEGSRVFTSGPRELAWSASMVEHQKRRPATCAASRLLRHALQLLPTVETATTVEASAVKPTAAVECGRPVEATASYCSTIDW